MEKWFAGAGLMEVRPGWKVLEYKEDGLRPGDVTKNGCALSGFFDTNTEQGKQN